MIELRPWQQETLSKVLTLTDGDRLCIQAPTGAGKNILLQVIARYYLSMGKKVLLMVDRIELVADLQREAQSMDIEYDIMTTQSVNRRKIADGYDVYLIDECHVKYPSVISKILEQTNCILIGVTATALSKGLGKIYGKYAYVPISFQELVYNGTLLAPTFMVSDALIDTSKLEITKTGEYELSKLNLDRTVLNNIVEVCDQYLNHGDQCMILAPSQSEAFKIKEMFINKKVALYVSDSKHGFEDFKKGEFDIVITVYALSKGFNHPNIRLIIDCRPLRKSIIEFIQGLGRGTRKMFGKTEFIYIDMCGNYHRFVNKYNKWRLNKHVRLDFKSRECVNCDHEYVGESIPAKCKYGQHLTYDTMKCNDPKCWVDFITEKMVQCPECLIQLQTKCLICHNQVNICNRICPHCYNKDFKIRKTIERKGLTVEYKESDLSFFRKVQTDYLEPWHMSQRELSLSILKTAFYYAKLKGRPDKAIGMYALTIAKTFEQFKDRTASDMYRALKNNEVDTGEYNIHLLEILINEHKKYYKELIRARTSKESDSMGYNQ